MLFHILCLEKVLLKYVNFYMKDSSVLISNNNHNRSILNEQHNECEDLLTGLGF